MAGYYATFFETNEIVWYSNNDTWWHLFNNTLDADYDGLVIDYAPEQFEPPEMEGYEHKLCSIYDLHIEGVYDL